VSASPKPIVARDQVRLGAGRCLRLALSGMSYRMFRSSVTMAILALAVAFVAHMLSFGLIQHETELSAYRELTQTRRLGQDLTRLTVPDTPSAILGALRENDAARVSEYRRWSGASAERFERAREVAGRLAEAESYFTGLPVAARAVLVGDLTAEELFDRLALEAEYQKFARQLDTLALPAPLGDLRLFAQLLRAERPDLVELVGAIERGQKAAIERIEAAFPGREPRELLSQMPPGLAEALSGAGYQMDPGRLGELRRFAERADDLKTINRLLLGGEASAAVARELRVELSGVSFDAVAEYVSSARRARWLGGVLAAAGAPSRLGPGRLSELVDGYRREKKLGRAVGAEVPSEDAGLFGLSERNRWLIALSFLVCVVGVANAMLMSVTERFTEIATMKCLGAMDRFVMMMFVFEAVIQGAVGGVAGLLLGGLLALARALVDYGSLVGSAIGAAGPVGLAMLGSLFIGVILAAMAAVGPAWIASRLAPMEAMRVE
jgi:hypothetical protein